MRSSPSLSVCLVVAVIVAAQAAAAARAPVFQVDFAPPPDIVKVGADRYFPFQADKEFLKSDGLRIPLASANLLPATTPDSKRVEFNKEGALALLPPVRLAIKATPPEKSVSFVFSCHLRAEGQPSAVKLLARSKTDKDEVAEAAAEAALSVDTWRRESVIVDLPVSAIKEEIVISLKSSGPATILMERPQLERCRNYPQFQSVPTDWMPCGGVRPNAAMTSFPLANAPLSPDNGALVVLAKMDPVPEGRGAGELTWLTIGAGWDIGWEISDGAFIVGGDAVRFKSLAERMSDGKPHQLAMTWTPEKVTAYLDGAPIGSAKRTKPFPDVSRRQTYQVIIGTHPVRRRTCHGAIAAVAGFDQALTPEELRSADLLKKTDKPRLSLTERNEFTRAEIQAGLKALLRGTGGVGVDAQAVVVAAPGVELKTEPRMERRGEDTAISIPLAPFKMEPGKKECRLRLSANGAEQNFVLPFEVRPARLEREDFTRDEGTGLKLNLPGAPKSGWLSRLFGDGGTGIEASAEITAAPGLTLDVKPSLTRRGDMLEVAIPLSLSQLSAGKKECRLRMRGGGEEWDYVLPFEVYPARPASPYGLMLWGCKTDAESLRRYREAGVGIADFQGFESTSTTRDLAQHGMAGCAHFNDYLGSPHPAAPENWEQMMEKAQKTAPVLARLAHRFRYCLLNSEQYGTDNVETSPMAMRSLKDELGLDAPPVKSEPKGADLSSRPRLDLKAYKETGVVPASLPELRYLEWLAEKGNGSPMANRAIADILRAANPGLRVLGEPAHPFIFRYGFVDGRDVAGAWCYSRELGEMQLRFNGGQAFARHNGIGFYPILGYVYCLGQIDLGDGKKGDPSVSPDAARARLWLCLAQQAEFIAIWNYEPYGNKGWGDGELSPGLYEAHTATMKEINRLGPVFGPLPMKHSKLALLCSFTTQIGRGHEQWWHWFNGVVSAYSTALSASSAFHDLLFESDIRDGRLDAYSTLVIPAALYLPDDVHGKISEWSRKGGKVVLDNETNPAFNFTNQEKLESVGPNKGMAPTVLSEKIAEWGRSFSRSNYVTADSPDVMPYSKESGPANYVIAINNKWEARPKLEKLRDIGVAQKTTLRLREPSPNAAVYDLLTGKRVDATKASDGTLSFPCELGPGAGRPFAIYPEPIAKLEMARNGDALDVKILDAAGRPVQGRQGLEVEVRTPDGALWDSSGIHAADNGKATIPLRLPVDAAKGTWKVSCREMASGLRTESAFVR